MGLDLLPQNKPLPGHEAEWRALLEQDFRGETISDDMVRRFQEISVPVYASIGAPRVGFDPEADQWMIEKSGAKTPAEIEECLKNYHGYYAVALLGPPACPPYSNAAFGTVDETSFRGAFFNDCQEIMGEALFNRAWESMWPEEAVAYGHELLKVAAREALPPVRKPSWLAKVLFGRNANPEPLFKLEEAVRILRAAGEWYIFWGERGYPIKAWS